MARTTGQPRPGEMKGVCSGQSHVSVERWSLEVDAFVVRHVGCRESTSSPLIPQKLSVSTRSGTTDVWSRNEPSGTSTGTQ